MDSFDFLIVGAGFSGAVCAQKLAEAGYTVLVIDRRDHIGGNAYDYKDAHGVLIHPYGPHIFHTNSEKIFSYLSRFTDWRPYEHRVLACVAEELYPFPINRTTINKLYGLDLDSNQVAQFLEDVRERCEAIKTSEDLVLNAVGADLCDKFYRGYTRKQWGLDLSELSAGVAARIPIRHDEDDRYFTDKFQFMPSDGYSALFERLLSGPGINVQTSTSLEQIKGQVQWGHMIYTGPIDAFFDFQFGKLPYRSLMFKHEHIANADAFQSVGTINFPNDHEYTRITEFKHLTGQKCPGTSIVREYPQDEGDPYYPIPRAQNEALFQKYKALAETAKNVTFIGRLAEYRYYNMDQVVGAALAASDKLLSRK